MGLEIRIDDLQGIEIASLLREHLDEMHVHSPPESVHALDVAALQSPDITFWTAWENDRLAGCGALKELSQAHGEIKSMRTAKTHLRQGVATKILNHLLQQATSRSYTRLSLETGSMEFFVPARHLYERFGFEVCAPFADYSLDPNSVFMTKRL